MDEAEQVLVIDQCGLHSLGAEARDPLQYATASAQGPRRYLLCGATTDVFVDSRPAEQVAAT